MKHDGQLSFEISRAKMGIEVFFDQIHLTGQLVYNYTSLDLWWIY